MMSTDPPPTNDPLRLGVEALQAGRAEEAARHLRSALEQSPQSADAAGNLGVALMRLGRTAEALECSRRASELNPADPAIRFNFGNALQATGSREEAIGQYEAAVGLDPNFGPAYFRLGNCLRELGNNLQAVMMLRRAAELLQNFAPAHLNLGKALRASGSAEMALPHLRTALGLAPRDAECHAALAAAEMATGAANEAERHARNALALRPDHADALNVLGVALQARELNVEACQCYEELVRLNPQYAEGLSNYGAILNKLGRHEEAIPILQRAIAARPDAPLAHANLAASLNKLCRLCEAAEAARRALELDEASEHARMQLAYALHYQGDLKGAIECYREIVRRNPDGADAASNLLYVLTYSCDLTPADVAREHVEYGKSLAARTKILEARTGDRGNDASDDVAREDARRADTQCLRIGYVSPDFRSHSVALFLEPILDTHDRKQFEIYCYSNVARPDEVTTRFKNMGFKWREIRAMSDREVADRVRRDRIDILVDLAGHTSGGRLAVFAMRPAPVQVSYLGYPNTTGLAEIDYYLTDRSVDPPGEHDEHFTERLWRLDGCKLCYRPRTDLPEVGPLPARKRGFVTFGSFNNLVKYTPRVLALWARVLKAVPGSRLVLKAMWFRDPAAQSNFATRLAAEGIGEDRFSLIDFDPSMDDIDIALDPFPFNGATTTCHAFWMGLPLVALRGDAHCSCVSASLLHAMDLDDLIAGSEDEYVAIAARLAGDLDRLAELRATLRDRLTASPICDAAKFTRDLEAAYCAMWKETRKSES